MKRIIALDVGHKNVGVAHTRSGVIAEPIGVWPRRPEIDLLQQLRELIENEQTELVVVGRPEQLSGIQQIALEELAHEIERLGVPVQFIDEDWSTQEAQARLQPKKRQPRDHADAAAAQVILERYLES